MNFVTDLHSDLGVGIVVRQNTKIVALERGARDAANGMDVRIGGEPNTIQQYLRTGLIDELHIAISPVLLGGGERLFEGIDMRALGYECVQFAASEKATMLYSGAKGTMTPNNRFKRTALPRRR